MPPITTPVDHRFPWYVRLFFWNQRRKYGAVLEPARLWGRSPRVFLGVATLFGALERRRSPVEPLLRSLVTVRVSQINWCRFCVDINSALVLRARGKRTQARRARALRGERAFQRARKGRARVCRGDDLVGPPSERRALRAAAPAFRRRRHYRAHRDRRVPESFQQVQCGARCGGAGILRRRAAAAARGTRATMIQEGLPWS